MGRHRKHELGDIVRHFEEGTEVDRLYVVVEYDDTPDARKYRVVPLDAKLRRAGRAYWRHPRFPHFTGLKSAGSVKTHLANEKLADGDRGCECQCCIHEAYNSGFCTNTGGFRD